MSDLDPNRQHDWRELKVTPLTVVNNDLLIIDLGRSVQTSIGCWRCNMGYDEGKGVNCPGQDLFEESDDAAVDSSELRSDSGPGLPPFRNIADMGWGHGEEEG